MKFYLYESYFFCDVEAWVGVWQYFPDAEKYLINLYYPDLLLAKIPKLYHIIIIYEPIRYNIIKA